jgi:hypothetical protein
VVSAFLYFSCIFPFGYLCLVAVKHDGKSVFATPDCHLITAASRAECLDHSAGFTRALRNAVSPLFLLAFGIWEIAIRELGPFLFQLALGDVPVAFDFECRHNFLKLLFSFRSAANMAAKVVSSPWAGSAG